MRTRLLGCGTLLMGLCVVTRASAQEPPAPGTHRGVHYGGGVDVGLGGVGDYQGMGPWLEGAFSLDIGLSSALYVRIEPGIGWFSSGPNVGTPILVRTPTVVEAGAYTTEHNWSLSFLVRSTIGVDLGPWVTVRAGPVLGVVTAHVSSEVCSGSVEKPVYGATFAPEVRFGPRHRIEVGPQLDMVWMHSPYCVYQSFDFKTGPGPMIPYASGKPTFDLLLHASFHFW